MRGSTFLALIDQATNPSNSAHGQGHSKQEQHKNAMFHKCIRCITQHANETAGESARTLHDVTNGVSSSPRSSFQKKFMGAGCGVEPQSPED